MVSSVDGSISLDEQQQNILLTVAITQVHVFHHGFDPVFFFKRIRLGCQRCNRQTIDLYVKDYLFLSCFGYDLFCAYNYAYKFIDFPFNQVYCETTNGQELPHGPYKFKVAYDKLVIASGSEPLTFNISGVKKHAIFLREVRDAQEIRRKLLLNLMLSENPGIWLFYSCAS